MPSESVKWPPNKRLVFAGEVREILRKPAGKLITGSPREVAGKIKWIIESEKPPLVVAVGDYTSRILSENDVDVNLYIIDGRIERKPVELTSAEREAVKDLAERIKAAESPEEVQSAIFEAARSHGIEVKNFFKKLYLMFLGRDRGPRLGPYLWDLGKERAVKILEEHVRG